MPPRVRCCGGCRSACRNVRRPCHRTGRPAGIRDLGSAARSRASPWFASIRPTGATAAEVVVPFPRPVGGYVAANPTRRDRPILASVPRESPGGPDCAARMLDMATLTLGAADASAPGPVSRQVLRPSDGREVIASGGSSCRDGRMWTPAPAQLRRPPRPAASSSRRGAPSRRRRCWRRAVVAGNGRGVVVDAARPSPRPRPATDWKRAAVPASPTSSPPASARRRRSGRPACRAGRYYVRIRALNGNGVSAPSNEVIVDVP